MLLVSLIFQAEANHRLAVYETDIVQPYKYPSFYVGHQPGSYSDLKSMIIHQKWHI